MLFALFLFFSLSSLLSLSYPNFLFITSFVHINSYEFFHGSFLTKSYCTRNYWSVFYPVVILCLQIKIMNDFDCLDILLYLHVFATVRVTIILANRSS